MVHTGNGKRFRISAKEARRECTKAELDYAPPDSSKKEIEDIGLNTGMFLGLGQKRFMSALALGAHIEGDAHNIFVEGLSGGSGLTLLKTYLEGILKRDGIEKPDPNDFVYVHNFKAFHKPLPIRLKKGAALEFKNKLHKLLEHLRKHISAAFANRAHWVKMNTAQSEIEDWTSNEEKKIKDAALKVGFLVTGSMVETGGQYTLLVRKDPTKSKKSALHKNGENSPTPEKEDEYEKMNLSKLSKKQKTDYNILERAIHQFYAESQAFGIKVQMRTFEEDKKSAGVIVDGIFDSFFTESDKYRPDSTIM
ncbi:MAG: AAA family ATPase, partial [bacterium]|nr:AAA family ATPase [bacterium]